MVKIKPVGIQKNNVWLMPVALILTVSVIVGTVVSWLFYRDEFKFEYLLKNGVEVEATVVDYKYGIESSVDGDGSYSSGWYYIWECYYNDRTYGGTSGSAYFTTEEQALAYLGHKFTVTVDPNSSWAVAKPLEELRASGLHFKEYLTCAIVFSCLVPFVLIICIDLIFAPQVLDYKFDRCGNLPVQGEVIKTRWFLVGYVKVRYKDKKGETRERWSYAWFTRRELKFLEQKKVIQIVPYKNTFGVLEEIKIQPATT